MEIAVRFEPQNSESFERLFRQYNRKVLGWFLSWNFSREVAEDLVQETFMKVFEYGNDFIEDAASTYLWRAAQSKRVDWLRKWAKQENVTQSWDAITESGEEPTVDENTKRRQIVDPESQMIEEADCSFLLKVAVATYEESRSMTSDSLNLFIARYIEEMKYEEIAPEYGLTKKEAREDFNNTAGKFRSFARKNVDFKNHRIVKTKLSSKR